MSLAKLKKSHKQLYFLSSSQVSLGKKHQHQMSEVIICLYYWNGSIKKMISEWRSGWDSRFCKQTIGLVLGAPSKTLSNARCRKNNCTKTWLRSKKDCEAISGWNKALKIPHQTIWVDQTYILASDTGKVGRLLCVSRNWEVSFPHAVPGDKCFIRRHFKDLNFAQTHL